MQEEDIEVTPEMDAEGRLTLLGYNPDYDSSSDMVKDIYRVMELERRRAEREKSVAAHTQAE